jgi:hypothetical protein
MVESERVCFPFSFNTSSPTVTPNVWRDIGLLKENFDEDSFLSTGKLALMDKSGKLQIQ